MASIRNTIHKTLRCAMKDQVRLSLDVRYQSTAEPIEEKSIKPHCDLTWAESTPTGNPPNTNTTGSIPLSTNPPGALTSSNPAAGFVREWLFRTSIASAK